jgi:hypothetical protein
MNCTRCNGTGFLNLEQVHGETLARFEATGDRQVFLVWIDEQAAAMVRAGGDCSCHISPPCNYCILQHDVQVCDCCGDGENWYGEPGQHDLNDHNAPFPQCY